MRWRIQAHICCSIRGFLVLLVPQLMRRLQSDYCTFTAAVRIFPGGDFFLHFHTQPIASVHAIWHSACVLPQASGKEFALHTQDDMDGACACTHTYPHAYTHTRPGKAPSGMASPEALGQRAAFRRKGIPTPLRGIQDKRASPNDRTGGAAG